MNKTRQKHSFINLNSTLTPQGLQTVLRIQRDPINAAIGYAVLKDPKGPYSGNQISLIIPLMFPRMALSQSITDNKCVKFLEPIWVQSRFVEKAKFQSVCFIRKVKALNINFKRDGFSLGQSVWNSYSATFTYPIQMRTENRHFPALLSGLSRKMKFNHRGYTFVIELVARERASPRFVIVIDYQLRNQRLVGIPTVTVINIGRELYLANAVRLAKSRKARMKYTPCDLLDGYGKAIPTEDIVRVNEFNSYSIHDEDNGYDKPPPRPAGKILTTRIDTINCRTEY